MENQIDYSGVMPTEQAAQTSTWRTPRHVFFGKRDPNTGQMEEEPIYTHKDYPSMRYRKNADGRITALVVNNEDEDVALADGYVDTPEKLGLITHPSFDQMHKQKREPVVAKEAKAK